MPPLDHETLLRRSFTVAERARGRGNHPFGAILVNRTGDILLEVENGYLPEHGHAERLLATATSKQFDPKFLADCTLTARPGRAACAPAPPIGPVSAAWVYGLSERRLKVITGNHAENPTLDLPCCSVFAAGQRHVEVIGPLLVDEAAAIHAEVWD